MKAYSEAWRRYADFSGKTSRRDFWMALFAHFWFGFLYCFCLAVLTIVIAANQIIQMELWETILRFLVTVRDLAFTLPCIAMAVRRLRDAGYSAKSFFWLLIPVLGMVAFIARLCEKSYTTEESDNMADVV